jgi:hypothetical protein
MVKPLPLIATTGAMEVGMDERVVFFDSETALLGSRSKR